MANKIQVSMLNGIKRVLASGNGAKITHSRLQGCSRVFSTNLAADERLTIRKLLENGEVGADVSVNGWVKTVRRQKRFSFVEMNDGTSTKNLQIVMKTSALVEDVTTGSSIQATGMLQSAKSGPELSGSDIVVLGNSSGKDYPLQKKKHSNEFLREILHLRPRTTKFGAIMRIRSELSFAFHQYFRDQEFIQVHAPILTGNDCEGAGEVFSVNSGYELFGDNSNKVHLTVSSQLHAEMFACALSKVYSFGPTFRAENSNTSRHLCEFWMVEPEMAFQSMNDSMELAENCVKYVLNAVWEKCQNEIQFLAEGSDVSDHYIDDLDKARTQPFERIAYDDAIEVLNKNKNAFEIAPVLGQPLQSEHERYISEIAFSRRPVFITHFPCQTKPFYAKHGETEFGLRAKAMDLVIPRYGEVIGGSEREESFDLLKSRLESIDQAESLAWYLELRKYGTVPHSGWGLGFDRLLMFLTGVSNIRDVVPVPRYPSSSLKY